MDLPFPISAAYRSQVNDFPGGAAWFARLPAVLQEAVGHWSLRLLAPFDLSYNYVCPALRADGTEVVLKIGLPTPEFDSERSALQVYAGDGIVQLLDYETNLNAMLLERIRPGTMLSELSDDVACMEIAGDVMQRLWKPAPAAHAFPTTADWAKGLKRLRERFDGGTGPIPERLAATAEALFRDLFASEGEQVLLHGDLHHFNILRAQREPWLALDPKGVVGEREYEIGALVRNPDLEKLDDSALLRQTLRRIDQLSEKLGFDRKRLIAWCHAQDVLSNWWGIEDNSPWEPVPRMAAVLEHLV